ncbi:hypothetical protein ACVGW7_17765, partial [Enterobacter intestinihominis]
MYGGVVFFYNKMFIGWWPVRFLDLARKQVVIGGLKKKKNYLVFLGPDYSGVCPGGGGGCTDGGGFVLAGYPDRHPARMLNRRV